MSSYWSKRRRIARGVEMDLQSLASSSAKCGGEGVYEVTEGSGDYVLPGQSRTTVCELALSGQSSTTVCEQANDNDDDSDGGVSDDDDDDDDDDNDNDDHHHDSDDTQSQLAQWAVRRRISHAALGDLLSILSGKIHGLPKDPRKVKKAALANESPDPQTWTLYPVVILKVKETYEKAHNFYMKAKKGESLDTTDDDVKRKRKPNMKFSLPDYSSEDDDNRNLPPPPKIPRAPAKKKTIPNSELTTVTALPVAPPLFRSSHAELTSQTTTPPSTSPTSLPVPPQQDFYRLVLQHLRTIEEELKEVKQQVAVNTAMIQRLGGGGVADLGLVEDTNMPLSNAEDLDELERRLISDVDLKNQLVNILAILGGKTTKDAVKRMLGRAFRRSLALQINWTGAAGKIAFKSLNLKSVLHRAVRRVVTTATEEELQKEVSLYLKGAADREGGRKDRQKRVVNGDGEC